MATDPVMTRGEFQRLARTRIREARSLFRAGHFDGAYYLAGYAIEFALKACIARQVKRFDFPNRRLAKDSYTHDLGDLLKIANLERTLSTATAADPRLFSNWATAKDWNESSRYSMHTRRDAQDLISAIGGRSGMLQWLRQHW